MIQNQPYQNITLKDPKNAFPKGNRQRTVLLLCLKYNVSCFLFVLLIAADFIVLAYFCS